ncbi:MAG: cytochrome C peroxidase [Cytophagales bacterium]|nr:cytochrome C peroxidase [Cytophagales bacterium]
MKRAVLYGVIAIFSTTLLVSFQKNSSQNTYVDIYRSRIHDFSAEQSSLLAFINKQKNLDVKSKEDIKRQILNARSIMKRADFWLRYLEPLAYKKINSPLPVEWETEVFEKYEKPYKRVGAGLTLALLYLEEEKVEKDTLAALIAASMQATQVFHADSITDQLKYHHHLYLANRLFLLNLAAIYTTGFECPDTSKVIPELKAMLQDMLVVYGAFNESFPDKSLSSEYMALYQKAIGFVHTQPQDYSRFDHFAFIRDYINPLYAIHQKLIKKYKVYSKNNLDYSLNKEATSIFDKKLYNGQNPKGIFLRVTDSVVLSEIDRVGKLLFYDPILSANNKRSCVSCHNPSTFFTDTTASTSLQFNGKERLPRNTPSLVNADYNHLLMADGKHFTLQHQGKDVITNPIEMGSLENEVVKKVLSCPDYKKAFTKLLTYTPQEKEVTIVHIVSAITYYYGKYSTHYSAFDKAIEKKSSIDQGVVHGFNVFMGKGQCGTCHFVPLFNGVKPPYIGSEFEVLGTPADKGYKQISPDKGRYSINPATETDRAFRTGTIRNAQFTQPYMHNGVFTKLEEVIDFYDTGGGVGHGFDVPNQTLSSDSLKLTMREKSDLILFIKSLTEEIPYENPPLALPASSNKSWNNRKIGGEY